MRIALLEDDAQLAELLALWLESDDHRVSCFHRGQQLLASLRRDTYDLLILDWLVPDLNGEEVLAWVRDHMDWHIPVLFVTQRDTEEDIVRILTRGADDYLVKPVRPRELLARVGALARRSGLQSSSLETLEYDPFRIDPVARTITRDGHLLKLTHKEFDLALLLFQNAGRLLSRNHIMEQVWGRYSGINTRTVDTHISRLRGKLGLGPESGWILTGVYQHGYRMQPIARATADT